MSRVSAARTTCLSRWSHLSLVVRCWYVATSGESSSSWLASTAPATLISSTTRVTGHSTSFEGHSGTLAQPEVLSPGGCATARPIGGSSYGCGDTDRLRRLGPDDRQHSGQRRRLLRNEVSAHAFLLPPAQAGLYEPRKRMPRQSGAALVPHVRQHATTGQAGPTPPADRFQIAPSSGVIPEHWPSRESSPPRRPVTAGPRTQIADPHPRRCAPRRFGLPRDNRSPAAVVGAVQRPSSQTPS